MYRQSELDPIIMRLYLRLDDDEQIDPCTILQSIKECHEIRGEFFYADAIQAIQIAELVPNLVDDQWTWAGVYNFNDEEIDKQCSAKVFRTEALAYLGLFHFFVQATINSANRNATIPWDELNNDQRLIREMVEKDAERVKERGLATLAG